MTVESLIAPPVFDFGMRCRYCLHPEPEMVSRMWRCPVSPMAAMTTSFPRRLRAMGIRQDLDRVHYYGMGPGENYQDSRQSNWIDSFQSTVSEMWEHYPFPQDNGKPPAGALGDPDQSATAPVSTCGPMPHQPERLALQLGAYPRGATHQRAGAEWVYLPPQSGSQVLGPRLQLLGL